MPEECSSEVQPSQYERDQIEKIIVWKREEPGVVKETVGRLSAPIIWALRKIVPDKAIEGSLKFAQNLGEWLAFQKDILRDTGVEKNCRYKVKRLGVIRQAS